MNPRTYRARTLAIATGAALSVLCGTTMPSADRHALAKDLREMGAVPSRLVRRDSEMRGQCIRG